MTFDDRIRFAWLGRPDFPRPCAFCGEPIEKEHAYRTEYGATPNEGAYRCERCLCKLDPATLTIQWGLTRTVFSSDGEPDDWEPIGYYSTLAELHERAQKIIDRFSIVKWYKRAVGSCGPTLWTGWADRLPSIEWLQQKADGTLPPPAPLKPCAVCGKLSGIICRVCNVNTCWDHRRDGLMAHKCDDLQQRSLKG